MKERSQKIIEDFFVRNKDLESCKNDILKSLEILLSCILREKDEEGTIFVCGNGGSAADSQHIAGELLKSFVLKRKIDKNLENKLKELYKEDGLEISKNLQQGIKCIPLDSFLAFQTAFANDCNSSFSYAQLLSVLARGKDVLISISTSGNSKNCLLACKLAKALDIKVISLTGKTGGKIKSFADVSICTPSTSCYLIQEFHIKIYHLICLVLESEKFDE